MKKSILITLQIIALFLIQCITNTSQACSISSTSGSVGAVTPTGGPVPGYITDIVANGTSTLSVTYTPSVGSPTTSNISLGTGYCTVTGSWHGTKITSSAGTSSGGVNKLSINGTNVLTFSATTCGPVGSVAWSGSTGGATKVSGNGTKQLIWNGYNSVTGVDQPWSLTLSGSCQVTDSYAIDSSNAYVISASAFDATSVEFFWDDISLGTDSTSPFSMQVFDTTNHLFSVKANFSGGSSTVSDQPAYLPQVVSGTYTNCFQLAGRAYCWGKGQYGATGSGGTTDLSSPNLLSALLNVSSIGTSQYGGCAVANGGVYCWGKNDNGILTYDPATFPSSSSPVVAINEGSSYIETAVGDAFACARSNGGKVRCWGAGGSGQMGVGTTTATNLTPTVVYNSGVLKIAAGGNTACALLSTGHVECWGLDNRGQVGNGGTAASAIPSPVDIGLTNIYDIAVGYRQSCALDTTNHLYCWGDNSVGQLGQGTSDSLTHKSPELATAFASLNGKQNVFSGRTGNVCVTAFGDIMRCVGENGLGTLGDGATSTFETTPTSPSGFTSGVLTAGVGLNGTAFKAGHVYYWGDNTYGEIGNSGASNPQLVPIQVTGF